MKGSLLGNGGVVVHGEIRGHCRVGDYEPCNNRSKTENGNSRCRFGWLSIIQIFTADPQCNEECDESWEPSDAFIPENDEPDT